MASDEEVAWAAGLFEGEGSIYIQRKKTTNGSTWEYAHLKLGMTDEDVVQRFRDIVGVGSVSPARLRPPRKPMYYWACNGRSNFRLVAEMLRPWLGERRLAKLAEVELQASPVRRLPPKRRLCLRGHLLEGQNSKPNGYTKGGRLKTTCRICANARYRR
jgi:hypothetical protein